MRAGRLSRRAVLRGGGSVAVGLPLLELMIEGRRARAAAPPKRFCMLFAGAMSAGTGTGPNHFVPMPHHRGSTPLPEGPDYPLTEGLKPLGTHRVREHVAIVSGLLTPSGTEPGPARWRGNESDWHSGACYAQIMGCSVGPGGLNYDRAPNYCRGEGPDYLLARTLEPDGSPSRVLNLSAQPVAYGTTEVLGTFTYKRVGANFLPVANRTDPGAVWDMLFKSLATQASTGAATTPRAPTADDFQASVLDLVKADARRLMARAGAADRVRLEQHFDEINDLEKKIRAATAIHDGVRPPAACRPPADPRGRYLAPRAKGRYSGEHERARIMADLVHMAFVCDLTRVASLLLSYTQSLMEGSHVAALNKPSDLHESNHGGCDALSHGRLIGWHVDQFAYLVAKLAATPEAGRRLIDQVGMLMFFEGGAGRNFSGRRTGYGSHQSEDVVILVAGHAGNLKVGRHFIEKGANPASVTLTVMRALGHTGPLNEVTATVPRLLG